MADAKSFNRRNRSRGYVAKPMGSEMSRESLEAGEHLPLAQGTNSTPRTKRRGVE
ncbi:hypothetical protein HDC34_003221 [Pseudoclavibacter sp. JAI123]|nr:hypothetical protein [Pseudoclavibacter sp. JAI123]